MLLISFKLASVRSEKCGKFLIVYFCLGGGEPTGVSVLNVQLKNVCEYGPVDRQISTIHTCNYSPMFTKCIASLQQCTSCLLLYLEKCGSVRSRTSNAVERASAFFLQSKNGVSRINYSSETRLQNYLFVSLKNISAGKQCPNISIM